MNGICPICGCKTEELDFVDASLEGKTEKTCSFCAKQLHGLYGTDPNQLSASQLHWLHVVADKEVPARPASTAEELKSLDSRLYREPEMPITPPAPGRTSAAAPPAAPAYGEFRSPPPAAPQRTPQNGTPFVAGGIPGTASVQAQPVAMPGAFADFAPESRGDGTPESERVQALEQRVALLEKALLRHKRSHLIKGVLEIIVPVILALVLLLVFFKSGLFDQLKTIFNVAGMFTQHISPEGLTAFFSNFG